MHECNCVFTVSHVVDAVQVALAFLIVHVLTSGSHDLDRVMAEEDLTGRPAEELTLVRRFGEEIQSQNFNICSIDEVKIQSQQLNLNNRAALRGN